MGFRRVTGSIRPGCCADSGEERGLGSPSKPVRGRSHASSCGRWTGSLCRNRSGKRSGSQVRRPAAAGGCRSANADIAILTERLDFAGPSFSRCSDNRTSPRGGPMLRPARAGHPRTGGLRTDRSLALRPAPARGTPGVRNTFSSVTRGGPRCGRRRSSRRIPIRPVRDLVSTTGTSLALLFVEGPDDYLSPITFLKGSVTIGRTWIHRAPGQAPTDAAGSRSARPVVSDRQERWDASRTSASQSPTPDAALLMHQSFALALPGSTGRYSPDAQTRIVGGFKRVPPRDERLQRLTCGGLRRLLPCPRITFGLALGGRPRRTVTSERTSPASHRWKGPERCPVQNRGP